ncbi:MAG TPA: MdtA/MuxA family multidrug efflux RND transporter periplasmic adaptor subunit [Stellaceae bacterium]|jgi:multidrug efflux system membrane fusion protein|nr:MdtA/MuxA family multidrug efflux RND transporter periplasmic adaptor subunit [Stellaceae bacterium]
MTNPNQLPPRPLPPPRRPWLRRVLVLVAIVIVLAAAWHWWLQPRNGANPPAQNAAGVAPRGSAGGRGRFQMAGPQPVGVATVTKGDIDITLNALGTVTPLATVTVQTQINGQLVGIGFTEGQIVKKGDFLAQIDPRPYQVALEQAQGQLARDEALLQGAQVDLVRYQKLAKQNSIAQQQADDQLYLVKQYEGTVKLDEASVDNAKLNLVYCHITSPVTGKAGLRLVDVGNYVQTSSSTGIVVLTQLQPITVVFPVAEDFLPQIQKRIATGAKLAVTAYDRGMTSKLAAGTLYAIDSQIDPTTGTVKLKAQFDNADLVLFPQQFVNAQLLIDTLKDVVIAPTAAVQRGAPGTFVFLVKGGNKVAVTTVKLGPVQGEQVAVLSGLSPGDQVVVDGADRLRDGSAISIPQANKGGTPTGGGHRRRAAGTAPKTQGGGPSDAAAGSGSVPASAPAGSGGSATPPEDAGTNAGTSSPVKGKTPNLGGIRGPGYNPPVDQETNPAPPAKKPPTGQ